MTRREQQILAWITENPLISQRELAERPESHVRQWQCISQT